MCEDSAAGPARLLPSLHVQWNMVTNKHHQVLVKCPWVGGWVEGRPRVTPAWRRRTPPPVGITGDEELSEKESPYSSWRQP